MAGPENGNGRQRRAAAPEWRPGPCQTGQDRMKACVPAASGGLFARRADSGNSCNRLRGKLLQTR
jgi:hypothetical protein